MYMYLEYLVFDKETEKNENYSQSKLIIPQPQQSIVQQL